MNSSVCCPIDEFFFTHMNQEKVKSFFHFGNFGHFWDLFKLVTWFLI